MSALADAVVGFLTDDDWPLTDEGGGLWTTLVTGSTATWGAAIQVLEAERIVVMYSLVPLDPSPERLPLLLEFAARATWGLATSTFEVDVDAGSSRLRTGVDVEHLVAVGASDAQLRAVVRDLVYTNVAVMDIVLPLAIGVIVGELSPSEAAARIGE